MQGGVEPVIRERTLQKMFGGNVLDLVEQVGLEHR